MLLDPDAPARLVFSPHAAPPAPVHLGPIGAPSGCSDIGGGSVFDPRSRSVLSAGGPRRRHWVGHGAALGALRSRHRGVAYLDGGCGGLRPPLAGFHGGVFLGIAGGSWGGLGGGWSPFRGFPRAAQPG